jgi:hypothetical protein
MSGESTLHAYRDAIRGLLIFAAARRRGSVMGLSIDDLGRETVLAFLEHLERDRGDAAVTRNARAWRRFILSFGLWSVPPRLPPPRDLSAPGCSSHGYAATEDTA